MLTTVGWARPSLTRMTLAPQKTFAKSWAHTGCFGWFQALLHAATAYVSRIRSGQRLASVFKIR